MSIDERAIWHEAGHSVVALSVGLPAADIWYKNGNFECTHLRPQCYGISLNQLYVVLAAGAAAEKLRFAGDYNTSGSSADAARISELGGTTIEDYLPEALEILAARRRELELMAGELGKRWCQSIFTGRPNPFLVMSAGEVAAVREETTSEKSHTT